VGVGAALAFAFLATVATPGKAYVYWTDPGPQAQTIGTTLGRVNLDGRGLKSGFVKNASRPTALVSDGKFIYWANSGTSSIGRVATNGTGSRPKFIAINDNVSVLAIAGQYLYFAGTHPWIGRVKLDGTQLNKNCISLAGIPNGMFQYGGTLYVADGAQIERAPATCSQTPAIAFVVLANQNALATNVTVAGGFLYWDELDYTDKAPASSIGRAALSDPAHPDDVFVSGLYFPLGVASDGKYLYWVDHGGGPNGTGAIGREQLGTKTSNYNWINDKKGAATIAVDALIDPTSTTVTCSPTRVAKNNPTVCTAVVRDSASSEAPAGTVLFHGSSSVFFPGGNSCTLSARPGGGASCTVGAESTATGKQAVKATYEGNATHHASAGSGTFCAGSKAVCKSP
jgi:hypothetical protein